MKAVRNSAKAIIIRDNQLLVIKNTTDGEDWFLLPGGGQNHGESLREALARECMEEASVVVEIGDIVFIRDYISRNHEFAETDKDAHQVEFMFQCSISEDAKPSPGSEIDQWQTGVEWLPLDALTECKLYPAVLRKALLSGIPENQAIYLGDVN